MVVAAAARSADAALLIGNQEGNGPKQTEYSGQPEKPGPLGRVLTAAHRHGSDCGDLNQNKLAALMMAPIWEESVYGEEGQPRDGKTPHPMALSRNDTPERADDDRDFRLYWDPNHDGNVNDNNQVYWHPGLGMWQLDDTNTYGIKLASGRFRPYFSMAHYFADRFCENPSFAYIYQEFLACGSDGVDCQTHFERIYRDTSSQGGPSTGELLIPSDLAENLNVDYWGGIEERMCEFRRDGNRVKGYHHSPTIICVYVDPANGENVDANNGWLNDGPPEGGANGTGTSPLSRPFYIMYRHPDGKPAQESRVWLEADWETGRSDVESGVVGERPIGSQSRETLRFDEKTSLCDVSVDPHRGNC
jgi:hypothetical protein